MLGKRQNLRRSLFVLVTGQSGYFTAAQARDLGYSYSAQKYHVDHGNWLRVDRGLFRMLDWPPDAQDSLVRWSLWAHGRAVVSHDTALSVHELGDVDPALVHMTVPKNFRATSTGIRLHRGDLPAEDILDRSGYRITTPLRSLLDAASGNLDLDLFAGAVTDALDKGVVTRRQLLRSADAFGAHAALRIERALQSVRENP